MTTVADTAVSRRALLGLGFARALEGVAPEVASAAPASRPPAPPPSRGAGEADATRMGPSLLPLARVVLRRLLPAGGGGDVLIVGAGDGTPVVELALADGHAVAAVERDPALRGRGVVCHPTARWHAGVPAEPRYGAVLAWFGATHDDPRELSAALRSAARPGGLIGVAAWTPGAMERLREGPRPSGHRPEHWSRYETAYRHFFDLPDLDVEPLVGPDGLAAALVLARAPEH